MSTARLWLVFLCAAGAAAISACAGSGEGLDENGQPIGSGGGAAPLEPTLQSIQVHVFDAICINCHIGANAPQGLQLDASHSYALLVGVPSNEASSLQRVQAGNPDNSYLIRKLEGAAGIVGGRMPLNGPYLQQSTIDVIRQWIANGAAQSVATSQSVRTQSFAPSLSLTVSSPPDRSIVSGPVPQIVLAFSGELDASLVNAENIWLERTDVLAKAAEVDAATTARLPATLSLAAGNPASVILRPQSPLESGAYRVMLRGSGGGVLADIGGATLSGDSFIDFVVTEPGSAKQAF